MSNYMSRRGKNRSQLAKGVRRRREERFEKSTAREYSAPAYHVAHVQQTPGDANSPWMTVSSKSWF